MIDSIEEFLQIKINAPAVARGDVLLRLCHRLLGRAPRPEAVALVGKPHLPDGLEHVAECALHDSVSHGRDAKWSSLGGPQFWNPLPSHGARAVASLAKLSMQLIEILRSVAFEPLHALAVDACSPSVAADSFPGRSEVGRRVHLVHQTEPTSSFHPGFQGCQHPCRPHRRFHPGPSGRDISGLFSPRGHCRRSLFLRCVFHGSTSLPRLRSTAVTPLRSSYGGSDS